MNDTHKTPEWIGLPTIQVWASDLRHGDLIVRERTVWRVHTPSEVNGVVAMSLLTQAVFDDEFRIFTLVLDSREWVTALVRPDQLTDTDNCLTLGGVVREWVTAPVRPDQLTDTDNCLTLGGVVRES